MKHPKSSFKHAPTSWEGFLVLSGQDNYILGVYGSALQQIAQEQADKVLTLHPCADIRVVSRVLPKKPHVGEQLT